MPLSVVLLRLPWRGAKDLRKRSEAPLESSFLGALSPGDSVDSGQFNGRNVQLGRLIGKITKTITIGA